VLVDRVLRDLKDLSDVVGALARFDPSKAFDLTICEAHVGQINVNFWPEIRFLSARMRGQVFERLTELAEHYGGFQQSDPIADFRLKVGKTGHQPGADLVVGTAQSYA